MTTSRNAAPFEAQTLSSAGHIPVMLAEVLAALRPADGQTYVDATFGAGGYTRAILEAADCKVLALDRDPSAISAAAPLIAEFTGRLDVIEARFATIAEIVRNRLAATPGANSIAFPSPDCVVFDIGVSSMQLDEAERGFSFQTDGPLDMRMGQAAGALSEGAGPSAADVINETPESDLADIFYQLGEERRSRAIAAAIVRRRAEQPFSRTRDLASVVAAVPGTHRPDGKHPATRVFQALRIWVNDELGELARGLLAAEAILSPGGRLVVVTFHSLEDRIVKRFMAERSGRTTGTSRHLPSGGVAKREPSFRLVNSKSLSPSKEETATNPRSRSARLRWVERTAAPPWDEDFAAFDLPDVLALR